MESVIDGSEVHETCRFIETNHDTRAPLADLSDKGIAPDKHSNGQTDEERQFLKVDVVNGSRNRCPCIHEPEGRDAWLVATVSIFITFCLSTELGNFGMYYPKYTEMFDASKATVGWIKGIQSAAGGICGLVTSTLVKVYGARTMGCMAGLLFVAGYVGASLSPNIYVSYLTHGITAGIGVNIANTCVLVIIQQHFTRNGVLGSGLSYSGFAFGNFTSAIIASKLIEVYGTRGALLLHASIFAHIIPFSMLLRPSSVVKPFVKDSSVKDPSVKDPSVKEPISKQIRRELCDFTLLRDPLFVCIAISAFLAWYTTAAFVSHMPSRAIHYGVPMWDAAFLQSAIGLAAIVGRLMSTFLGNMKCVNVGIYYGMTLITMAAGPFTYAFFTTYHTMFISPILFGLGMGSSATVYVVVLVRMFTVERLPRALGLYQIASHIGMSLGPPISGLIYDETLNYDVPFLLCGSMTLFASFLIFIVAILHKRRHCRPRKS